MTSMSWTFIVIKNARLQRHGKYYKYFLYCTCSYATMMDKAAGGSSEEIIYTPREAILHSADFLQKRNHVVNVRGTVVLVDSERSRLDISHNGAKLIVRLMPLDELPQGIVLVDDNDASDDRGHVCQESETSTKDIIQKGTLINVRGMLRKEQRRTYMLAVSLSVCHDDPVAF
jgi:hypothetical protein